MMKMIASSSRKKHEADDADVDGGGLEFAVVGSLILGLN